MGESADGVGPKTEFGSALSAVVRMGDCEVNGGIFVRGTVRSD